MDTLLLQVEPPADFLSFLLWFVGILVSVVGTMFWLLKKAMESRIADRDATIGDLKATIQRIEAQRDALIEEVKSSFDVANHVFQKVIENLQK